MISQLLFYSLIGGFFSLAGSWLLLWRADFAKRFILPLLSFGAGAFLGAAFLDILPEAIEMVSEPHPVFIAVVIGFVFFFALERVLMRYFHVHSAHEHADHTESLPFLLIAGDCLHNFLDGVVIGLAYLVNPNLGLVTTLAIAAHEIPQEIGDATVLLNQGWPKRRIILVNIGQSLLTVPGALIGYAVGMAISPYLPYLLALAGGMFIYIAASDIIPEIHHRASHRHAFSVLFYLVIGVALVGVLSSLAHAS